MTTIGARLRRGAMFAVVLLGAFPCASRAAFTWSAPVFVNDYQQTPMDAVVCPSASQCTAVDQQGSEVTFDPASPSRWSSYAIDRGVQLAGVACPTTSQCTAVDVQGWEVTFDPASTAGRSRSQIDSGHALHAVACPLVDQCTAVDGVGQELTFDPTDTSIQISFSAQIGAGVLSSVACPSNIQCTAVQTGQDENGASVGSPQLITFDPAELGGSTTAASPAGAGLGSIVCPSLNECVATAQPFCASGCDQGATITFDPSSNSSLSLVTRSQAVYVSLACSSVSQCTAMDPEGQEVTFDPTSSSLVSRATFQIGGIMQHETRVACPGTRQCAAVAYTLGGAEVSFDPQSPGKPAIVPIDDGAPTVAVTCSSPRKCVAVAKREGIYLPGPVSAATSFVPGTATNPSSIFASNENPSGISCPGARQCTVVSQSGKGCGQCSVFPGGSQSTFRPRATGTPSLAGRQHRIDRVSLTGVWCPTLTQCTATDVRGHELTFNPRRPRHPAVRRLVRSRLTGVVCPTSAECVAVDRAGQEVTFDPAAAGRSRIARIDGRRWLLAVSCPAADQCTAIDTRGGQVTFDPVSAHHLRRRQLDRAPLTAISCASASFCMAVDTSGRAVAGNPRRAAPWSATALPGAGPLLSVFCISTSECIAGDSDGHIFTGRS